MEQVMNDLQCEQGLGMEAGSIFEFQNPLRSKIESIILHDISVQITQIPMGF